MTRSTLMILVAATLTGCSVDYAPEPLQEPGPGLDDEQPGDVVEEEPEQPEEPEEPEQPEEPVVDEPLVENFQARPAMSTTVYDPQSGDAVSDVCVGDLQELEVVDGLFEAQLTCFLQTYGNVYTLDFEGELFADDSVEGTVTLTLNGRSHVEDLEWALVDGQTRIYWEGTWEYLASSHIDFIGSMDLQAR